MMRRLFLIGALLAFITTLAWAGNNPFVLVIDAGHGGHDHGAPGAKSKEKDINLSVALAFGRYVERNCPDVKVIYTRKTDVFIALKERANIANRNNADLFISIHTNAVPGGKIVRGLQTYTLGMHRQKDNLDVAMRENSVISLEKDYKQRYQGFDPKSSESYIMFEFIQSANMERSVELAKMVQNSVCASAHRIDKGVHQAGFLVLRETSMPGCLIELGFITTPDEEDYLNTNAGVDALARGIYNAFAKYKNKFFVREAPYIVTKAPEISASQETKAEPKAEPKKTEKKSQTTQKPQTTQKSQTTQKQTTQKQQPATQKAPAAQQSAKKAITRAPVYKVLILTVNRTLRPGSQQFKGYKEVESFKDGNLVKYTIGSSTDYNAIAQLRKTLLKDFPDAAVIAFADGQPVDINEARQWSRQHQKK